MANTTKQKVKVATWSELADRKPQYALVGEVDLVIIRYGDDVSVLYGRCLHRGALMSDGTVQGDNLICGVHGWDYRVDTGVSEYNNSEALHKFSADIDADDDAVYVDNGEIDAWAREHPQTYDRDEYQGLYADLHGGPEETAYRLHPRIGKERPEEPRPSRQDLCDGVSRSPRCPAGTTSRS